MAYRCDSVKKNMFPSVSRGIVSSIPKGGLWSVVILHRQCYEIFDP